MMSSMRLHFKMFLVCLLATMVAHVLLAQRYYADLPLGSSVYDGELKVPLAVEYLLTAWSLGDAKRVHSWQFLADVPDSVAVVRSSFYKGSGYDRGHMMAAADRSFDPGVMRATFVMSNVAPQAPNLNRGSWARAEAEVREIAIQRGRIRVYNAPLFFLVDTPWIEPYHIAIPHAYVKVAMSEDCDTIYRYWVLLNR